jgi:endonuclease/exonuclease/phosphatase family metal-dependent hydrolase
VAASSALACAGQRIVPVTRPNPAHFDACGAQPSLSILTWNIFMMPEWLGESPLNQPRAAAIAATLLEERFDIVCLQKVFDPSARAILERALSATYPHRYGPANQSCLLLNSGVWVLSRYPLTDYQEIAFRHCDSWECYSRKGALLLSGTCGNTPFRLIATHLQGESGSAFTAGNQAVRNTQIKEIRDRLIVPHLEPGIPFLICGDFGTPRFANARGDTTTSYNSMLATLGAQNGPEPHITLDEIDNELAHSASARRNEVDYILARKNGCALDVQRTRRIFKRSGWDTDAQRSDLSYHYAVSAVLKFG